MFSRNHEVVGQTFKEPDDMAKLKRNADNMVEKWHPMNLADPPISVEQHEKSVPPQAVKNEDLRKAVTKANEKIAKKAS